MRIQQAGKLYRNLLAATRWTLVLSAARDNWSTHAAEAMAELCRLYWYPLYAFVRRRGYDVPEAEDLTQSFFTYLLAKKAFAKAHPAKGKFRSFLLASLNNFLIFFGDVMTTDEAIGRLVPVMQRKTA